ncbi:Os01g0517850 [Oryza sativa Japonica Group]|nr:Os01g0517850 [Oryza sativa Japonica Group]
MTRLPYAVVDMEGKPHVLVEAADGDVRVLSPEEIAAAVLAKMKKTAEAHLGRTVSSAVVAVPVYFNDAQRRAISDAGDIAGLDVMRIVSEPIAAAVAYGLDNVRSNGKRVVVFDLGGENLDVTALVADDGFFDVLATNGDGYLGGEGFDQRVVNHFVDLIKRKHGRDITGDGRAMHRLRRE